MHSPSLVTDSLWPHGLWPTRLLCPRVSPGKNTGVGCHVLLQAIFPAQGLNPGLPYCRQNLYHLSCQGSPSDEILGKEKWNTVNKATTFLKKAKGACKKKKKSNTMTKGKSNNLWRSQIHRRNNHLSQEKSLGLKTCLRESSHSQWDCSNSMVLVGAITHGIMVRICLSYPNLPSFFLQPFNIVLCKFCINQQSLVTLSWWHSCFWTVVLEKTLKSPLGQQGGQTSPS